MPNRTMPSYFFILTITVFLAIVLNLIPFPRAVAAAMPQWFLLLILFWVINKPEKYSVGFAFSIGLLADAISGSPLGLHAFLYVFLVYCLLKLSLPFTVLPLWQQMLGIALFTAMNLILLAFFQHFLLTLWLSIVSTALVWPLINNRLTSLVKPERILI